MISTQEHCQGRVGSLPLNIDFSQYLTITATSVLNNLLLAVCGEFMVNVSLSKVSFLTSEEGCRNDNAIGYSVKGMDI